jgi:Zn-dependent peptidase ImmA (M78 family)
MNLVVKKFKSLRIGWNKKPIGEPEINRLSRRLKVKIQEMPLRVAGFYLTMRGKSFICVDERLGSLLKLKIKLHELAHRILHTGQPHFYLLDPNKKEECEAEVFALCCLIPRTWVKTKTFTELVEIEGFDAATVWERWEISDKYKNLKI